MPKTDAEVRELLALHAAASQKDWVIRPNVHEETCIVEAGGRGLFGRIADVSTSPSDYGRGNIRWIIAAHNETPALLEELLELRALVRGK